MKAVKTREETN